MCGSTSAAFKMEGRDAVHAPVFNFFRKELPATAVAFKSKIYGSGSKGYPLPESLRRRTEPFLRQQQDQGNVILADLTASYILMKGVVVNDPVITQIYGVVENDDTGRDLLLRLFASRDEYTYQNNLHDFVDHISHRDLQRGGAGAGRAVRSHVLTSIQQFPYLGTKVILAQKAAQKGDPISLKSFASSKKEEQLRNAASMGGYNFNTVFSSFTNAYPAFISSIGEISYLRSVVLQHMGMGFLEQMLRVPIKGPSRKDELLHEEDRRLAKASKRRKKKKPKRSRKRSKTMLAKKSSIPKKRRA